jgi:hypothetical protein
MAKQHPIGISLMSLALLLVMATDSLAKRPSSSRSSSTRSLADTTQRNNSKPQPLPNEVDRSSEAVAWKLVQDHLPELKSVLQRLRADESRQYNRAITDLARSAKKLEIARNRDEALYEIEAETLKAQNAVNLLTAKLKVRDNESDRQLLRHAVIRLQQAQIARTQYDVATLQTRLQRAQQQLQSAQQRLQVRREELDHGSETSYHAALKKAGRQPVSDAARPVADSARRPAADASPVKRPTSSKEQSD